MATSPSLPTYGIACSHNTSSLFQELCMFTELPLGDWFPFISPWHKRWTTLCLAAWNHTVSFSHIPQFPQEEQWLQPGVGGHLPAPRGDHPAVLGAGAAPKHFQVSCVREHPLVLLTGCSVKPCSFCLIKDRGAPPVFYELCHSGPGIGEKKISIHSISSTK